MDDFWDMSPLAIIELQREKQRRLDEAHAEAAKAKAQAARGPRLKHIPRP